MATIKDIYSNLEKRNSHMTTIYDYYNKERRVMSIGFDPYYNNKEIYVYVYWWDYLEIGMNLDDFISEMLDFVNKNYSYHGAKITKVQRLHIGTTVPEKYLYI